MNVRAAEWIGHLLFWVLTTWVILSYFTIQMQEIELVDGQESIRITRSFNLTLTLAVNQLCVLILFYRQLREIWRLPSFAGSGRFWWRSLGVFALLFGLQFFLVQLLPVQGPFRYPLFLLLGIFVFYYAVSLAYGFTRLAMHHERSRQQLLLEKRQSELHLLRSQLQPHFLFNTLNNLLSMVDQRRHPQLANSIERLASLLRYVVYDTQQEKIPIAKEIDFMRDYAALYQLRFDDGEVDFQIAVQGAYDQQPVEPGLFIPFLENAFKHGVQPEARSFVYVHIDLGHADKIGLSIENSRHESNGQKNDSGGLGLVTTRRRLELVYPDRHELLIEDADPYRIHLNIRTHESSDR